MSLAEVLRQALRLLAAHRLRSLLTLFGVVWGTAAVIFLVSWGQGVRVMLEDGFFKAGKNMGEVWAGKIGEDYTPAVDRRYLWFRNEDVEALRRRAKLPEIVGAEFWSFQPVTSGARAFSVDLRGLDPEAVAVRGVPVDAGRAIRTADLEHRRRVVVLGHTARRRLLGPEGGVGSWVRIAGTPFRVIGVLARVGTQLSRDRMEIDEQAWVPITTAQALWPPWWTQEPVVHKIIYRMKSRHWLEATESEVRGILARQLRVSPGDHEAIGIWSSVRNLQQLPLDEMRGTLLVLAIAVLVIGGVGVLNMMLDSVHERRQEIGVRRAVGARRRDVVVQFFLETFTVTSVGGGVGAALGVLGTRALAAVDAPDLVPVPIFGWGIVAVAVGVMLSVGLLAGVVPAWRASRIEPAETLRME
ncbi:MAG TPA: ABC transporter permease [Myxococcota bacterium]|nr:ABC transporter permease [Myxococcota bacterium]